MKMKLGDVEVDVVGQTKRKVLFRHPDGDQFVCDKKHLKPVGEKSV